MHPKEVEPRSGVWSYVRYYATLMSFCPESQSATIAIPGTGEICDSPMAANWFPMYYSLELLKLYRAEYLFKTHKMYQIPFVEEQLAARFDGQMLCTLVPFRLCSSVIESVVPGKMSTQGLGH